VERRGERVLVGVTEAVGARAAHPVREDELAAAILAGEHEVRVEERRIPRDPRHRLAQRGAGARGQLGDGIARPLQRLGEVDGEAGIAQRARGRLDEGLEVGGGDRRLAPGLHVAGEREALDQRVGVAAALAHVAEHARDQP